MTGCLYNAILNSNAPAPFKLCTRLILGIVILHVITHIYICAYLCFRNEDKENEAVSSQVLTANFWGSWLLFLGDKTLPLTVLVLLTRHSWTLLGVSHQESGKGHNETHELPKLKYLTGKNKQASLAKEWLLILHLIPQCWWETGQFSLAQNLVNFSWCHAVTGGPWSWCWQW